MAGQITLSGDALADPGEEQARDMLVIAGQLILTSPVTRVGYRDLVVLGQVIAPWQRERARRRSQPDERTGRRRRARGRSRRDLAPDLMRGPLLGQWAAPTLDSDWLWTVLRPVTRLLDQLEDDGAFRPLERAPRMTYLQLAPA